MDKETLSNYGWIVIAVMVLVVMIALATPFGKFVSQAVQSTTQGLFDVNQGALNAAGVPGLTIEDQEFNVPGNIQTPQEPEGEIPEVVYGATFDDGTTLSWEELKDPANCQNYGYDGYNITDTTIGTDTFFDCPNLKSIIIPEGITTIKADAFFVCSNFESVTLPSSIESLESYAFEGCQKLKSITFEGTTAQWNDIDFGEDWNLGAIATYVQCSDGRVNL